MEMWLMTSQKSVDKVRSLLRHAFHSTGCYELDFSNEDAVYWRENLYLLKPKDLQCLLPLVLEDLLYTHTEDPYDPAGMSAFKYDHQTRKNQRKVKLKSYASFTSEQAFAILKWLELAQSWGCFTYFGEEDIRFAISYWKQRAHK
jgi:hypothetical protein